MAKKKHKLFSKRRNKSVEDQRLELLAKEIGIAGMVVLVNDFGFSQSDAKRWLDLMVAQAKATRAMLLAKAAYEKTKGPMEDQD